MTGRDFEHQRCSHEKARPRAYEMSPGHVGTAWWGTPAYRKCYYSITFSLKLFSGYIKYAVYTLLSRTGDMPLPRPAGYCFESIPDKPWISSASIRRGPSVCSARHKSTAADSKPRFSTAPRKGIRLPWHHGPFPLLILHPEQTRPGQRAVPLPAIRPTKNEMELLHAGIP